MRYNATAVGNARPGQCPAGRSFSWQKWRENRSMD